MKDFGTMTDGVGGDATSMNTGRVYWGTVPPPPPQYNGGLFVGEPFKPNAPWANVPIPPDVNEMVAKGLINGVYAPGYNRPGNNSQGIFTVTPSNGNWN